jgi:hypothetical protein
MDVGSYIFCSTRTYTLTTAIAAVDGDAANVWKEGEEKERNERERGQTKSTGRHVIVVILCAYSLYIDVEKDHANVRVLFTMVHDIITNGRKNRRILAARVPSTRLREKREKIKRRTNE